MTPAEHIAKAEELADRPMTSVDSSTLNALAAVAHAQIARAMIAMAAYQASLPDSQRKWSGT